MDCLSTFDVNKKPLFDVLQSIHEGKIQLVDFQRSWCWEEEKIIDFLADVSLGFPIGSLLLSQQGEKYIFKVRPIEGVEIKKEGAQPKYLILDGQQRLTTLYMALYSKNPVVVNRGKRLSPSKHQFYLKMEPANDYPHTDREEAIVSVKIKNNQTAGLTRGEEFERNLFPFSEMFNFPQWRSKYCEHHGYQAEKMALIDKFAETVIKKVEHYQIALLLLQPDLAKKAICRIFVGNNTSSSILTHFDLLTSDYSEDSFDLRDDWERREKRFGSHRVLRLLKNTDFLQAVTLLSNYGKRIQSYFKGQNQERLPKIGCNRQEILELSLKDYQRSAEELTKGFEEAARFLYDQAIFDAEDIPYHLQIGVLATLFAILGDRAKQDCTRQKIEQWFYAAVASGVYSRSRQSTAAKDILQLPLWIDGGQKPTTVVESHLTPERLQNFVNSHGAAYRGISALLRKYGALDLLTGEKITSMTYFEEKIENHHIFPQAWAKKQGIPRARYNSIVNKTPLRWRTNRFFSNKAPSVYLAELEIKGIKRERIDELLRSHFIEPELLRNDDFEGFLQARTIALLDMVNKAVGK